MAIFPLESVHGVLSLKKIHPANVSLEDGRWAEDESGKHWVSLKPIRLVFDKFSPYLSIDTVSDRRCKDAWVTYSYIRAKNAKDGPWWQPKLKTRFDRLRYTLHVWLIRKGVLI